MIALLFNESRDVVTIFELRVRTVSPERSRCHVVWQQIQQTVSVGDYSFLGVADVARSNYIRVNLTRVPDGCCEEAPLVLFPVGTLNLILCSASITFREINLNKSMRSIVCVHYITRLG